MALPAVMVSVQPPRSRVRSAGEVSTLSMARMIAALPECETVLRGRRLQNPKAFGNDHFADTVSGYDRNPVSAVGATIPGHGRYSSPCLCSSKGKATARSQSRRAPLHAGCDRKRDRLAPNMDCLASARLEFVGAEAGHVIVGHSKAPSTSHGPIKGLQAVGCPEDVWHTSRIRSAATCHLMFHSGHRLSFR
jgi:hypothetical protein